MFNLKTITDELFGTRDDKLPINAGPGAFQYQNPMAGMGMFEQMKYLAQNRPGVLSAIGTGIAKGDAAEGWATAAKLQGQYAANDRKEQMLAQEQNMTRDWLKQMGYDDETIEAAINNDKVLEYLLKVKYKDQFPDEGGSNGVLGNTIRMRGPNNEFAIGFPRKEDGILVNTLTGQPFPEGWTPMDDYSIYSERARGGATAKDAAAVEQELREREANMPELVANTNKLKELAQTATQTIFGEGRDWVQGRVLGQDTEGGKARAAFESYLNMTVLPSLRATYGAQFTQVEGERLVRTLSDPTAAPGTKVAAIDAFIDFAEGRIAAKKRELESYGGAGDPGAGGGDGGSPPATPNRIRLDANGNPI